MDKDCPSKLTCIRGESCQDPCLVNNPCSPSQQCVVTDTRSNLRSVACICPEGTLAGYGGTCETVEPMPECKTDYDCGAQEKCHQGTCILACKLVSCGRNAQCQSQFHDAKCVCLSGYKGDPYSACSKGMNICTCFA